AFTAAVEGENIQEPQADDGAEADEHAAGDGEDLHRLVGRIHTDHDADTAGDEDADVGEEAAFAELFIRPDRDAGGNDSLATGLDDVIDGVVEVGGAGEAHGGLAAVGFEAAGDVGDVHAGKAADHLAAQRLHFLFHE